MASHTSVKDFAAGAAGLPCLDALLANARLFTSDFSITKDNETTIPGNVISTLFPCLLALPKLCHSVVRFNDLSRNDIPNSNLHYLAPLKELEGEMFANLNNPKTADMRASILCRNCSLSTLSVSSQTEPAM
jgi:hypothetical protein